MDIFSDNNGEDGSDDDYEASHSSEPIPTDLPSLDFSERGPPSEKNIVNSPSAEDIDRESAQELMFFHFPLFCDFRKNHVHL